MQHILIVEDNFTTARQISTMLSPEQYFTSVARNLEQASLYLERNHYDLVLLDRNLPDGDGLTIAEELYWTHREMPVLILSEKAQLADRLRGLRKGADEYMAKPFDMEELLLKMEKLLSKVKQLDSFALRVGEVSIFPQSGTVCVKDSSVRLRKRECEILSFLIRHKNQLISKEMLADNIWHNEIVPLDSTLAVYIRRIRMRLGKSGYKLRTIRGFGYVIADE